MLLQLWTVGGGKRRPDARRARIIDTKEVLLFCPFRPLSLPLYGGGECRTAERDIGEEKAHTELAGQIQTRIGEMIGTP